MRLLAAAALVFSGVSRAGADYATTIEHAREACSADAERLCLPRPRDDDPLRDFFFSGGPLFEPPPPFRDDPFLRMAATPPSISRSPSLLDEVFGSPSAMFPSFVQHPFIDDGDDDFADLARVLDGMMDSALRLAFAPPPRFAAPAPDEEAAGGAGEPRAEPEAAKDPEAAAAAALDAMVGGLLDHAAAAASASASASGDGGGVAEEEGKEEVPPNAREAEAGAGGPGSTDPLRPVWDPDVLSRKIAQHGRDVLEDEGREARAGADGDLRRRRLTAEGDGAAAAEAGVRGRLARRLTEVAPWVDDGDEFPLPFLGYGCRVDRCLWSHFRGDAASSVDLSPSCTGALEGVRRASGDVLPPPTEAAGVAEGGGVARRALEYSAAHSGAFWAVWAVLTASLLVYVCVYGEDEDEDDEEEDGTLRETVDYVLVEDAEGVADERGAERRDGEAVAFVGVPIRVI